MSRRTLPRPSNALYLLLTALLVFPCLARADEKDDQIKVLQQLLEKQQQLLDKQVAQTERVAQERKALTEVLKKNEARVADVEKQLAALRDQLTAAQLEARTLKARAEQLLIQLEAAQKELAKLKGGDKKPEKPRLNPAPEAVEGAVTKLDEKTGLVVVSIGTDSGLQKGHTLEVYRLQPQPMYLGTLEIIEVQAKEAVGRVTRTLRGAEIRIGDKVASKIGGN